MLLENLEDNVDLREQIHDLESKFRPNLSFHQYINWLPLFDLSFQILFMEFYILSGQHPSKLSNIFTPSFIYITYNYPLQHFTGNYNSRLSGIEGKLKYDNFTYDWIIQICFIYNYLEDNWNPFIPLFSHKLFITNYHYSLFFCC